MTEKFLDLKQIAENLAEAFPDAVPVGPLRLLGGGFGSLAVETTGGL